MRKIVVKSTGYNSHYDITDYVNDAFLDMNLKEGMLNISVTGSTVGLVLMRYEEGSTRDLLDALEKIAPSDVEYEHFKTTKDPNGFAHIKSCLLGTSMMIPYEFGKLIIPKKHKIVVFDFDVCSSERKIHIS